MKKKMNLKKLCETKKGLNTAFVDTKSRRRISLKQAIRGITNNNPNYKGYHTVEKSDGVVYVRSNPDRSAKNNIE